MTVTQWKPCEVDGAGEGTGHGNDVTGCADVAADGGEFCAPLGVAAAKNSRAIIIATSQASRFGRRFPRVCVHHDTADYYPRICTMMPKPPVIEETFARTKLPRTPVTVRASPAVAEDVSIVVYCASASDMAVCRTMLTADGDVP